MLPELDRTLEFPAGAQRIGELLDVKESHTFGVGSSANTELVSKCALHMCACVWVQMHTWRSEVDGRCLFQLLSTSFLRQYLSLNLEFTDLARLAI